MIRALAGHAIHSRMSLGGQTLEQAAGAVLEQVRGFGGSGGLIAVGASGEVVTPFNSTGMYRGWVDASGRPRVATGPR